MMDESIKFEPNHIWSGFENEYFASSHGWSASVRGFCGDDFCWKIATGMVMADNLLLVEIIQSVD